MRESRSALAYVPLPGRRPRRQDHTLQLLLRLPTDVRRLHMIKAATIALVLLAWFSLWWVVTVAACAIVHRIGRGK
jgi:hypothetical protein